MTSARLVIGNKFVCKRFETPELALCALERSAWLRRVSAVLTPLASRHASNPCVVRYARVHGQNLSVPVHSARCVTHVNLLKILVELAHLHSAPKYSGSRVFEPLSKVFPRLSGSDRQRFAPLLKSIDLPGSPNSQGLRSQQPVQLHGDAHPGQFITGSNGQTWMFDLDDMCVGPAEADLANLAAYLATRHALRGLPVGAQFANWSDTIVRSYPQSTGKLLSREVFAYYGRFAMLRRYLKLRERGHSQVTGQLLDFLLQARELA